MAKNKRRRKQQQPVEERITPTAERLVKGDVAVAQDNIYRSLTPTCLELWYEKGLLGSGKTATDRFEALQFLVELAEMANLMTSNTVDFGRVGSGGCGEGADISALDAWRHLLSSCTPATKKLLTAICCAPCSNEFVDIFMLQQAADEIMLSIERLKKNRTNSEYNVDAAHKM